jgi:glycogen(starch) synthase
MELNKGALDVMEMARLLRRDMGDAVVWDIAGEGSALSQMRRQADAEGLTEIVHFHGYCERSRMQELLAQSHVVLAPTQASFCEGFNKVSVEALLAHRPFITSDAWPAVRHIDSAGVVVHAGDVSAYVEAIRRLAGNPIDYQRHVGASFPLADRFLDLNRGWGGAVRHILDRLFPAKVVSRAELPTL